MSTYVENSENIVLGIVGEELDVGPEQLVREALLIEDLNADSLALINIVMTVEEKFKIDVPEEDWRTLRTVGDIIAYVRRMAAAAEIENAAKT